MSARTAAVFATIAVAIAFSAPAFAAAKFSSWQGRDQIYQGKGGEMEDVNGVQFWSNGDPPRSFKLLGYISDTRLSTGLIGMMRVKNRDKEIAEVAKANGGDAVILVDAETATRGYVANANAFGSSTGNTSSTTATGYSTPVQNQSTRYAVIKYVEDAQPSKPAESSGLPKSYYERVKALQVKVLSGEIPAGRGFVTQQVSSSFTSLQAADAAMLEGRSTWWTDKEHWFIHLQNVTSSALDAFEFALNSGRCSAPTSPVRKIVIQLERPLNAGDQVVINFTNPIEVDMSDQACGIVSAAWGKKG